MRREPSCGWPMSMALFNHEEISEVQAKKVWPRIKYGLVSAALSENNKKFVFFGKSI